mmetsp:Transcript_24749/g.51790  ORF Transcript_24749/g.51790 Transcript_24749/m.51790 type:complete len:255 (+) Transcript_24749:200-964(+)
MLGTVGMACFTCSIGLTMVSSTAFPTTFALASTACWNGVTMPPSTALPTDSAAPCNGSTMLASTARPTLSNTGPAVSATLLVASMTTGAIVSAARCVASMTTGAAVSAARCVASMTTGAAAVAPSAIPFPTTGTRNLSIPNIAARMAEAMLRRLVVTIATSVDNCLTSDIPMDPRVCMPSDPMMSTIAMEAMLVKREVSMSNGSWMLLLLSSLVSLSSLATTALLTILFSTLALSSSGDKVEKRGVIVLENVGG